MNRRHTALARRMNAAALAAYEQLGRTPLVVDVRDWGDLWRTMPNEPLLPRRDPAECGTPGGYARHLRAGEKACVACLDAHAEANSSGTGTRLGRVAA